MANTIIKVTSMLIYCTTHQILQEKNLRNIFHRVLYVKNQLVKKPHHFQQKSSGAASDPIIIHDWLIRT